MAHLETGRAFGLNPAAKPDANWTQLKRIWSGKPEDAEHRRGALRAIRRISMEANELNVEYGYRYSSTAVVPDGSPEPQPIDDVRLYEPSTRPGSPLPHAWIDDESGKRRPLKDLVAPGRFLLIAGEDGQDWCAAPPRSPPPTICRSMRCGSAISTATCSTRGSPGGNSRHYAEAARFWCGPDGSSAGAAPEPRPLRLRHSPKPLRQSSAARSAPAGEAGQRQVAKDINDAKRRLGARATGNEGIDASCCDVPRSRDGRRLRNP